MLNNNDLHKFSQEIEAELKNNILEFWINHTVDEENGGFYGFLSNDLTVKDTYQKLSVLTFRILWTYSTAYRFFKDEKYLKMAERAYDYIIKYFIDTKNSGVYWMLDYKGAVLDSKKQTYAIAFAIYGLSEYFRATGIQKSLDTAIELYHSLENHIYDKVNKGYIEATSIDWSPTSDMSLGPKSVNAIKSMNTHLHVMEAYTNLLRVWDNTQLRESLKELINVTIEHIIDPQTYNFKLFFDEKWNSPTQAVSFGHDIEGSWLLFEAAEVLGDTNLLKKTQDISIKMARRTLDVGIDRKHGGLFNERDENMNIDATKYWWPLAEAVVGFANAYQLTKDELFMKESIDIWHFIDKHIIDKEYGEWFCSKIADGSSIIHDVKVGPWKCPYHNSRMGFEIIHRFKK